MALIQQGAERIL